MKVGVVFVTARRDLEVWPYVNFDYESRKTEILQTLQGEIPEIEFIPIDVQGTPDEEIPKVRELAGRVDGLLVSVMCTNWWLTSSLFPAVGELNIPALLVDEPYAGSGVFLCHGAAAVRGGAKLVMLSTCGFQDVVETARCFGLLNRPEASLDRFFAAADRVRRANFATPGDMSCLEDPVKIADVSEVLRRLKETKILRVVGDKGESSRVLGTLVETVTFEEINAVYRAIDRDEAASWSDRWIAEAREVIEPTRDDILNAAAVYLSMKKLLEKRGAQAVTMDCLGGFYSGKLPGYPCLGYRQINDDGLQCGTCEAQIQDMTAMMICRYMFGRASYTSDPVLDTSTNQIIYAHCVAPTKMLGPNDAANPFLIRSHAEDNRGASIQSLLPVGYMTTSFRFNRDYSAMAVHQAKTVGNVDEPKACRTKLAAEVKGDIEKLFYEWDRFSWHRLTVYGDVREPLEELARALKMDVVREA
ncbi:MAG: hypothetical protein SCM96_00950 [Acidobacteriota bacterium]|nr:hypothetical protein [Acidobacteriota bacterium]